MAFVYNFTAFRHAGWGGPDSHDHLVCLGEDISSAQFAWAFAHHDGATAEIRLENAPQGAQGIHATYDADLVDPQTGLAVGGTYIVPQIDRTTLESLADPVIDSAEIEMFHTLYVTPSGAHRRVECHGKIIIKPGVAD